MKKPSDYVITLGATCVLALSVVLAQDQAPAVAAKPGAAAAAEAGAVAPAAAPGAAPAAVPGAAPAAPSAAPAAATRIAPAPASGVVPGLRTAAGSLQPSAKKTPAPLGKRGLPSASAGLGSASASSGVSSTNEAGEVKAKTTAPSLKFDNAPVDIIVSAYCEQTAKTPLWAPDAPKANITLKSQGDAQLTRDEYLEAIELVLSMNGVALEPFGDKFIKVLARKTVRTDGVKIVTEGADGALTTLGSTDSLHPEKGRTVSHMIQLKAITAAEAQKALEGFKKPDGLFQVFERTNSILVTDTQENVNRMLEIIKFIDQPMVVLEKVYYKVIRYAKADDIKKRIEELVAESQKQTQAKEEIKANAAGAPGMTRVTTPPVTTSTRPLPPGLTRLGGPAIPPAPTPNETFEALVSDAERGMIRGKVQIIADERTNQLIFITREDNMAFFEKIIDVLDIETPKDVKFEPKIEVVRLKFAEAEEVAGMLNELINGIAKKEKEKDDKAKAAVKTPTPPGGPNGPGNAPEPPSPVKTTTLAEAAAARKAAMSEGDKGDKLGNKDTLGEIKDVTIMADKRINAIIMMGKAGHLEKIRTEIIDLMDVQLKQVLIETVALEIGLGDQLETGIDWVKRVKSTATDSYTYTYTDSDGKQQTKTVSSGPSNYRYGVGGGAGSTVAKNLYDLGTNVIGGVVTSGNSGLEYLATVNSLNLDFVIKAAKSDNSAKVLSSPILLTVDNVKATIEATEMKYMYKGMRYMGYSGGYGGSTGGYGGSGYEPDIEQRDVGLTVDVTPRINPEGNVMLTVEETFEDVLGSQTINGQDWPTITTRKLNADVSVRNGETIILGGLVKTAKNSSESGIPILKDIPYIGKYLFGSVKNTESRSELLVFLTPYVIETPEDMAREARRRKDYVNATDIWTKGWSDSKLADPVADSEMKDRLARKKDLEKAWRAYRERLEEQFKTDERVNQERSYTESVLQSGQPLSVLTNKPAGTLSVSQSVEVLKPSDGAAPSGAAVEKGAASVEGAPVQPAFDQPKRSWWKRVF